MKLATVAFILLALCPLHARAESLAGKPVPLFPKLTWGLDRQAALAKGLATYARPNTKADVIGLPSVTMADVDFSAQAVFDKKDMSEVPTGLNSIVLQHEGVVSIEKYNNFIHWLTGGFLYAGRASVVGESAVFYNAINGDSSLVVTTADGAKPYLSVAIAPGISR